MAKKPKKPSAGPGAARQRAAAAAQSGHRPPRGGFGLAALREVTSSHAFTMQDEARNTGHRSSPWREDTRLRTRPVGFVSAGFITPLKEDESQDDRQDAQPVEGPSDTGNPPEAEVQQALDVAATEEEDLTCETAEAALEPTIPSPPVLPSSTPAATALASTTSTTRDSPGEATQPDAGGFFIDVTGDKTFAPKISRSPPRVPDPPSSAEESDSSTEVILFKGRNNIGLAKERVEQNRTMPAITLDTIRYEVKTVKAEIVEDFKPTLNNGLAFGDGSQRQVDHGMIEDTDDEEAAIIADYIANMAEDSEDADGPPFGQPFLRADLGGAHGDFDDDSSQSSMSSDDSAVPDQDGRNGQELDGDGDGMASPAMDDETLARLLAKQEELGMGSDELLLASGVADGEWAAHYQNSSHRARRGKGAIGRQAKAAAFPSASAVADAFDDLDLMDWQRPSLQNHRKRGRRGQPPVFGLSDSETEQNLQASWLKDRESKKSRKMQREELRAQGLLGKHASPDDPRIRYPTGMTLEDIKTEMRSFLEGSEPRLELPPMDKGARATLHELARKFKVKSQSTGSGNQRRPTLIRTKYTASYSEVRLDMAVSSLGRQHFPRLDLKGKGKATATPKKPRAGAGNSAVTYQEGEVVGASAPELAKENKGRVLLEKMGWSSGMGLGSLDNKGILQPVAHVVKRTKAGLG